MGSKYAYNQKNQIINSNLNELIKTAEWSEAFEKANRFIWCIITRQQTTTVTQVYSILIDKNLLDGTDTNTQRNFETGSAYDSNSLVYASCALLGTSLKSVTLLVNGVKQSINYYFMYSITYIFK